MTALTLEQKAAIRTAIAEAEAALHKVMLNQVVSRITDQNGETVTFTGGVNASRLRAYIKELKAKLPDEYPVESVAPMGFIFGRM